MRRFIYIVLGLMIVAGAGALLVKRQLRLADDGGPAAAAPGEGAAATTRSLDRDRKAAVPAEARKRRIDQGVSQYRTPAGGWKLFEAVIDILNVVVGIVGIGLALSGIRMRDGAGKSQS